MAGFFTATIGTTFEGAALLGAASLTGCVELGGPALALLGGGVAVLEGGPETGNGVDSGPALAAKPTGRGVAVGTPLDGSGVLSGDRTEGGGGVFE